MPKCGAFRAGAIVTDNENDQRVVELAHVLDGLNHAADFIVGVSRVSAEDIRLTNEQFLFIGTERVPFRELGSAEFRLVRPARA